MIYLLIILLEWTPRALSRAFMEREVSKRYRCIVVGRVEGEGEISDPIDGAPALSRWRSVATARSETYGWLSALDLFPVTGRSTKKKFQLIP